MVYEGYARERYANPIPSAVRRTVLLRAAGRCEECQCQSTLELHHVRYFLPPDDRGRKGSEAIFGRETPDDLRALCHDCHWAKHRGPAGEYYLDPEDRDEVWRCFDHAMED